MNKFMEAALCEAYEGIKNGDGGPFGAVVVYHDRIVGRGHNEVVKRQDCTCHGEIMAIKDACNRLGTFDLCGCDIYTTSEPCPMCRGAIQWANINQIFVGCNVSDAEDIGFRDKKFYATDPEIIEVDRDACLDLFNTYDQMKNKEQY